MNAPGGWMLMLVAAASVLSLVAGIAIGRLWARRTAAMPDREDEPEQSVTVIGNRCPTLVIDDDRRVLDITAAALADLGYEPLACHGPAAVPAVLRARRDIGLIVSDVQMPGIDGPALIAAIRELHPHVPVLFVTGLAGDIALERFGGHPVLRKPFTTAGLAAAIERLMPDYDRTPAAAA